MSNLLHRQAQCLFGTPLLAHPVKAAVVAETFAARLVGARVASFGGAIADDDEGAMIDVSAGQLTQRTRDYYDPAHRLFDTVDGIAVIAVEGSLVAKGAWIGQSSGATSYEGINLQVEDALNDESVTGVALEVDSFGGEVDGAYECASRIFALSQVKPTIAILTSHACSAGYLLASAASQILVPESGQVGSIGVIAMHMEMSKFLENEGIAVTVLRAGARKADFNAYEPLSQEAAQDYLTELEELRQVFAARVGDHRGERLTAEAALATEPSVLGLPQPRPSLFLCLHICRFAPAGRTKTTAIVCRI
ncbi:MAG: S49 family peptidase [Pseudomonadota bacterium]